MNEIKRPVLFSGENPGMTLYIPETEQVAAVASYWHCTDSPHGVGHALVLWLGAANAAATDGGHGSIFTDNLDMARVLVENLTQHFPEFREVPTKTLAYVDAACAHTFDGTCYRVVCQTPATHVEVTWGEIVDRKQIIWPQFPAGEAMYDLTTVICPCRVAHIHLNGKRMKGEVRMSQTGDGQLLSTAFLAFAETWIGPLEGQK